MRKEELENILRLAPFERYKYSIKRIADSQILYSLKEGNEDWAISEAANHKLFSIWSAEEYAALNVEGEWSNYGVAGIDLDDFLNTIIPLIIENNYLINVFSINNQTGFVLNVEEFMRDLNEELEKYE